ncbi:aminopeptidase P family protein [uncultured Muribaculum sp.]|uniref:aminopeptidase P family protein n=1 Tax=uncultured Muribaculum sp. TaxID=1918613 RepID=UPI0025B77DD5|nr:aminopeptidase P family protein [uncultured Muribaculum sp.]
MTNSITHRLGRLRQKMAEAGIDLALIPHADPHQSEYMADHWHVREFFSGFNGSAGTLLVAADEAALWTDSRYFLQAESQLEGTGIRLMKDGLPSTPSITGYIAGRLRAGQRVGIDGMLFSINAEAALKSELRRHGIKLETNFKPADGIWDNRPGIPTEKIFIHHEKYAGESASEKIRKILAEAGKENAGATLISALDAIAWTLNLRGNDVKFNPVFTAFLYLADGGSTLFIDERKLTGDIKAYLAGNGVETKPYTEIEPFIAALPEGVRVLADPASTSSAFLNALGSRIVTAPSPVTILKGIKNPVQQKGIHEAMLRDGVALVKSIMEIQRRLSAGETLTETGVAETLTHFRSQSPMYFDDSFGTIAGYKGHGAIVHYEADKQSEYTLEPDGLLLIDSGAQYLDGTTDITRTISLGNPTDAERHDFTLVMKGHIALGSAIFPEGTRGDQLDAFARQFLWKEGKSYLHGTGHGVGHFLNVHEGPQSIRLNHVPTVLRPGMLTSNEPGLYVTGQYGIRCENLVLTTDAFETEFGRFLKFQTVTLFPFDIRLFDTAIMTDAEIEWVNNYHLRVRESLTPLLSADEAAWLAEATQPLTKQNKP